MHASSNTHGSFAPTNLAAPSARLKGLELDDPVLQLLQAANLPVTRENYLEMAYPLGLPENWGKAHEASLPAELRRIII